MQLEFSRNLKGFDLVAGGQRERAAPDVEPVNELDDHPGGVGTFARGM
jgi:hypothetical protein